LSAWNVLEFKGPTDDPALRDLDLLVEVGLGIDRRLNEQRKPDHQPLLERGDVSWWYIPNHVGKRLRAEAERLFKQPLQPHGEGLWRTEVLEHPFWLLSRDVLPVDRESVPLHLVTQESPERLQALVREVVQQPGFWEIYGRWLLLLFPVFSEEGQRMSRELGITPSLDIRKLIEMVGPKAIIDQIGIKQFIDQIGIKQAVETLPPDEVLAALDLSKLTPQQLEDLKQRLS
jgi:hypothetical protein